MKFASLFLIFPAFISSASAQIKTLVVDQTSGYVQAQNAFQIHCELSDDGYLSGSIAQDMSTGTWGKKTRFSRYISDDDFDNLVDLIDTAEAGPIRSTPTVCDLGTLMVIGQDPDHDQAVPLQESLDCAPSLINTNPAAKTVVAWARKACNLR